MNAILYFITGILISILLRRFLFSIRSAKKFTQALLPTITSVKEYAQALNTCLLIGGCHSNPLLIEKKQQLQQALVARTGMYPEWVYKSGFNPSLRAGSRSFLIQLERIIELLFAIEGILDNQQPSFYEYLTPPFVIKEVMRKNEALMTVLENYFLDKKQIEPAANFTSDVTTLENNLQQIVPNNLELLDISPDYLQLTALVRCVKDMRQVLLSLVAALPS